MLSFRVTSNIIIFDGCLNGCLDCPKITRELSAIEIKRLSHGGGGGNKLQFVGGVPGLALQLLPGGGKTWILRTTVGTRRRDVGLGGYPEVSLAAARDRAREARELIRQGIDPVERRKKLKSELVASQRRGLTFSEAVSRYLKVKNAELKNAKHKEQWASTLRTYAEPELGKMLVSDISPQDILRVLNPIWHEKTQTASRLRGRIEAIMSWAIVSGHTTGDNPARWAGNLKELLPAPGKVAKSRHWPALDVDKIPAWFRVLRAQEGMGARALEFLTLCASRSGEVRHATWQEILFEKGFWIVPAERMKNGREHRIPLSEHALELLNTLPRREDTPYVFHAPRGGALSDMSVSAVMRRMHKAEVLAGRSGWIDRRNSKPAVPHGIRSTFRDWAAESGFLREVSEIALSHNMGSEVERAYRRTDMIERRRTLMASWANFLTDTQTANIIQLENSVDA